MPMAAGAGVDLEHAAYYHPSTLRTSVTRSLPQQTQQLTYRGNIDWQVGDAHDAAWSDSTASGLRVGDLSSTGKGILIGMLSAFGSAVLVSVIIALIYFLRYTDRGRILLDMMGRPGEYDDEQQFLREEEEALASMDDLQRGEYMRAKAFVQANPAESMQTDISLSQFLAIQEKGVSAWEFEPELEIANCFVGARTEIEFFDSVCSVQSNLPIPKQNEVYYWEAKLYDKPESTLISVGVTTKPYPLFRLPGLYKFSLAYNSSGHRHYNQPFAGTNYAPPFVQGDVVGVGYRPRTGTIFFTRNGKKLEDVAHGLKSQNFFPTVGATGPCTVHVNFGQMGFVFIEANVKKWGLAPMTGSLAPPPPYGSEAGSILLEGGRDAVRDGQGFVHGHTRSSSAQIRLGRVLPLRSPGPQRSPTDISLTQLHFEDSQEEIEDVGEGTSGTANIEPDVDSGEPLEAVEQPPPDYEVSDTVSTASISRRPSEEQMRPLDSPPIYEAATGDIEAGRGRTEGDLGHGS